MRKELEKSDFNYFDDTGHRINGKNPGYSDLSPGQIDGSHYTKF